MLRFAEMALACLSVVILTGTNAYYFLLGVPPGITQEEMVAYEGAIRNVYMLGYVGVVILSVLHWQKMILGIIAVWPIAVLVLLAWASNMWSVDSELTHRRCIAITVTSLMGVYLFIRFDLQDLLKFLTVVIAILSIGSIVWVFAVPSYGVHGDGDHAGVWRGIFFHKNTTGRMMVYSLAVVIATWVATDMNRLFVLVSGGAVLAMIAGTASQTALLGSIALIAGLVTVRMVRGKALMSALVSLAIMTFVWHVALLSLANYELILEALGRDASLTGRTDIWAFTIQHIGDRPFHGFGYDAFWKGEGSPGVLYSEYYAVPHSHNGWLELSIALGLPAAILMSGVLLVTMARAIFLARYSEDIGAATPIILMIFATITVGMSEPVFMEKHSFDWILLIAFIGAGRALTAKLRSDQEAKMEELAKRSSTGGMSAPASMMRRAPGMG